MNNDKLICIRDEDDTKLTTLLSDGWKIIQISASGIYCWVLLRKPNNTKKKINVIHARNVFIKRIWKSKDGISKNGSVPIVNTLITLMMKKIKEWFKSFKSLVVGEVHNPKHVFNCRDLIWISNLETSQNTPECFIHFFCLYWSNGMVVKVCQESYDNDRNSYQELYKLRELFINNIGYSYVPIEDNSEIYIYYKRKKDI